MHASFLDLIKLVLPESLFEYFQMSKHEIKDSCLHIYLEELNHVPPEYLNESLMSKGFFEEITIQDFPIRGYVVFLHVKRRRWINTKTDKVVYRDWKLVAQGTRITKDFADFLKQLD